MRSLTSCGATALAVRAAFGSCGVVSSDRARHGRAVALPALAAQIIVMKNHILVTTLMILVNIIEIP